MTQSPDRRFAKSRAAATLAVAAALFLSAAARADDAENLMRRTVDAVARRDAFAVAVEVSMRGPGLADGGLASVFDFAFRKPDRFARIGRPGGRIQATATYAAGRFVEHARDDAFMRGCYPDFDAFLERDQAGYLFLMNQFVEPDPLAAWMPNGSTVELDGEEEVDGVACARVALRSGERRLRLWISTAEAPLLLRAVELGADGDDTLFEVRYRDWRFDADVADDDLLFHPGPGMTRAQIPQEYDLLEEGSHQLLGKPDPLAETLKNTGQLDRYAGTGKVALQPYWRYADDISDELRELVIAYLGDLQRIENDYAEKGVAIMGVLVGGQDDAGLFFERIKPLGWTFQFVLDPDGFHASQARVIGFPTLLVIGRDGRVEAVYTGITDCVADLVREDIERLLAGERIHIDAEEGMGGGAEADGASATIRLAPGTARQP